MADEAAELRQLARQLDQVPPNAGPFIKKAVEITARNVKDDFRDNLAKAAGNRLRGVAPAVDYETSSGGRGVYEAEIGPRLGFAQGSFAGWFEDGAVDGVPGMKPGERAMKANEADFDKGLEIALADALKAAGL